MPNLNGHSTVGFNCSTITGVFDNVFDLAIWLKVNHFWWRSEWVIRWPDNLLFWICLIFNSVLCDCGWLTSVFGFVFSLRKSQRDREMISERSADLLRIEMVIFLWSGIMAGNSESASKHFSLKHPKILVKLLMKNIKSASEHRRRGLLLNFMNTQVYSKFENLPFGAVDVVELLWNLKFRLPQVL